MNHSITLVLLSIFLISCDAPQRTRTPSNYLFGNGLQGPTTVVGTIPPSGIVNPGANPVQPSSPGFENCDLSNKYHTIDIGFFGLCQSSLDETSFQFRPSLTSNVVRTCLIPTYKDNTGASTYVGNPQCLFTVANQTVLGKLYKDRPGYASYPINGVIVMKQPLLPEYIGCMQAYVNWPGNVCPNGATTSYCGHWLPRCPMGSKSNQICDGEARNYMANICNTFKNKYSNSYIDIRVK